MILAGMILCADVLVGLAALPDESVQCVVTSPPYYGLRLYGKWEMQSIWGSWDSFQQPRRHSGWRWRIRMKVRAAEKGIVWDRQHKSHVCALGLEPTPELFIEHMVAVFREVRRVLRRDGTCWVNLGDSYAGSWGDSGHRPEHTGIPGHQRPKNSEWFKREGHAGSVKASIPGLKPKDLCMMPARVALALQADGWWLRTDGIEEVELYCPCGCGFKLEERIWRHPQDRDIIWSKPNPMPESVTDRPTKSHEYVFLLTKSARYFYDADAVREKYKNPSDTVRGNPDACKYQKGGEDGRFFMEAGRMNAYQNSGGRNLRSVWTIPTYAFPEAHFATFPPRLVEPCVKAGTSQRGCCPQCGTPWERVVEKDRQATRPGTNSKIKVPGGWDVDAGAHGTIHRGGRTVATYRTPLQVGNRDPERHVTQSQSVGWQPGCACYGTWHTYRWTDPDGVRRSIRWWRSGKHPPLKRCVVLDPFFGAGTTGLVAERLVRRWIGIELHEGYCRMARRRIETDGRDDPKPPPQVKGQLDLFEDGGVGALGALAVE